VTLRRYTFSFDPGKSSKMRIRAILVTSKSTKEDIASDAMVALKQHPAIEAKSETPDGYQI
jgi:hypothetical protein